MTLINASLIESLVEPLLTPWFPAKVPPSHPGVYMVKPHDGVAWWALWNGRSWMVGGSTPEAAEAETEPSSEMKHPHDKWRGLAVDLQSLGGRT